MIVLTLFYSIVIVRLGIAMVNDFKSVEGDRKMGLQSLPVAFGEETSKWICVGVIHITELSIQGYLLGVGKPYYALAPPRLNCSTSLFPGKFYDFKIINFINMIKKLPIVVFLL